MLAEAADLLRRKSANLVYVFIFSSALSCVRLSNASPVFYHVSGHGTFLKHNSSCVYILISELATLVVEMDKGGRTVLQLSMFPSFP